MLETTKEKYYKDAQGFYQRHFDGRLPNKAEVLYCLHNVSRHYTPRSFSNLKNCLAFDMEHRGERLIAESIRKFKNPVSSLGYYPKPIRKIKTLSSNDNQKIINAVKSKDGIRSSGSIIRKKQLISAVWLARFLGCRPGEMQTVQRTGGTTFFITGIKKDEFGEKGLDRHIEIDDEQLANILDKCIKYLQNANMARVRDNFRYLMKKVFPRRKKQPTLYTFRHIMGSNLKKSSYSREEMAYIMGHQSTRTIENYGYRNAGRAGGLKIKPARSLDEIKSLVRDSHTGRKQKMENRLGLGYQQQSEIFPFALG